MPAISLRSTHPDATAALGTALAARLAPGDVVVLEGPLGAGKTRLVQGIAVGLGVAARVTSPTFVLVRRHAGRVPLVHVDAYRLEGAADLATLDDDVLAEDVVTCIEWGGNVAAALPPEHLLVTLVVAGDDGDAPRLLTLAPTEEGWAERAAGLRDAVATLVAGDAHLAPLDDGGADG